MNPLTKRILAFLSNILCYAPIKIAFLSVAPGKIFDQLIKIMSVKPTMVPATLHALLYQQQELVLMVYHTVLNVDISMIGNGGYAANGKLATATDLIVGCSLPAKDCLVGMSASILDWFFAADESSLTTGCQFAALKTMTLLASYE